MKAIMEWSSPTKVAELQSFLGLANYYKWFIQGYLKKVNPLTNLLKKDPKWVWDDKCQKVFDKLKKVVSIELVLKLFYFINPFEVHTNALDRALGGVLMQEGHLIAFEIRKLKDAKQRYSVHEKEMTIVIHCLDTLQHYFLGTKFIVVTNNVANTYFTMQKKLTPK